MDDASLQMGVGVGFQLKAPTREEILVRINLAKSVSLEKLIIHSDFQLVVGQVNGEYEMRDQRMVRYVSLVKQWLGSFAALKLKNIPRDSNEKADALAAVVASLPIRETVFLPVYYQLASSITTD